MQGVTYLFGNGAEKFKRDTVNEMRQSHDRDPSDGGISQQETRVSKTGRPYSTTVGQYRLGDFVRVHTETRQQTEHSDMSQAWEAARRLDGTGNDAIASYKELEMLLDQSDLTKRSGRREFNDAYGVRTSTSTVVLGSSSALIYSPIPREPYPSGGSGSAPPYGGSGSGGTAPGDGSYGSGGRAPGDGDYRSSGKAPGDGDYRSSGKAPGDGDGYPTESQIYGRDGNS